MKANMLYDISYDKPTTHFLSFKVTLKSPKPNLLIQLPNWRPGRYQIQNFAKRIKNLSAKDERGQNLSVKKVDKSSWRLSNEVGGVTINYEYFAFEMDAGNTWLDDEQVYINFINCCIYDPSQMEQPCEVRLDLPADYIIASGLRSINDHTLMAPNFYQLVDSPLMASRSLRLVKYVLNGSNFNIWLQGYNPKSDAELIKDFSAFTQLQVDVMHEFPCKDYHFLFQCLPYKHYHGVEHWNSTVITIGPSAELSERKLYKEFLGVSSHELFHTWNVIRLRPKEMLPYDFQQENYHETGFVTEGVTTYYGDLFLARSGVFSFDEYLGELNKLLKRHYDNEGRKTYSVAESSFDLWLDGYEKGIPGRKLSIYNEGALAALILDLMIRVKFSNDKSLDDVMRLMWARHGQHMSGYTYNDYKAAATSVFDGSLEDYFNDIISGHTPYEIYLEELLPKFGLSFAPSIPEKIEERTFGIRLANEMIIDIATDSMAETALSIGDKILKVNDAGFDASLLVGKTVKLTVNRFGRELEIVVNSSSDNCFSVYQASSLTGTDKQTKEMLKGWLAKCIA